MLRARRAPVRASVRAVGSVPPITPRVAAARAGVTMDREPGRAAAAAAGETEAAAAAAFGDATRQVGWRRAAAAASGADLRWTFRGSSRGPHFARTGSGCPGGAPRPPLPGLSGVTLLATGCEREKTGVSRKGCP